MLIRGVDQHPVSFLLKGNKLTYLELQAVIATMTDEQKKQDVTIHLSQTNEYYPLVCYFPIVQSDDGSDVLDVGHYYLNI